MGFKLISTFCIEVNWQDETGVFRTILVLIGYVLDREYEWLAELH